ncbi:metallopeptidase family protein [Schaalia naturae]|uniref:Metallopeptidase family protein n=1 Tax=Schaalia naturae TaxID=635203 RepID=A0ABW2SJB9_9ACTO
MRRHAPRVPVHPRRDPHGRGLRGPLLDPGLPGWRSRRERFDELVADLVDEFSQRWPAVSSIEFGIEDVPPSDPAPWETHSAVMARIFPADRRRGLADRIVVYRLPILQRSPSEAGAEDLTRRLLADRISHVLVIPPDELDEGFD